MSETVLHLDVFWKSKSAYSVYQDQFSKKGLFPDCHLSDRRFPDCSYINHKNIPDHSIDAYSYPDLHLPRPVHKKIIKSIHAICILAV